MMEHRRYLDGFRAVEGGNGERIWKPRGQGGRDSPEERVRLTQERGAGRTAVELWSHLSVGAGRGQRRLRPDIASLLGRFTTQTAHLRVCRMTCRDWQQIWDSGV
jgi:hypothetical protein